MNNELFTPASLLTCYNSALKVNVESFPVSVKGIYRPDRMNKLYGGVYYDRLTEENSKEELVIKVKPSQRQELCGKAEKLITVNGCVSRKVRQDSLIGVSVDVLSVIGIEDSKISEEERKFWEIQRRKAQSGKKDVCLLFKNMLFSGSKPRVALLWATRHVRAQNSTMRLEMRHNTLNLFSWTLLFQIYHRLSRHLKRWTENMMQSLSSVAVVPASKYSTTTNCLKQ